MPAPIEQRLAAELKASTGQITAAIRLLDEGATVPFIARYRKEATGGLDDGQLRLLEERLGYLRELEARRDAVIESVREQGKLDPALEQALRAADTKQALEDLYLPYRKKRRTKAMIAHEAGIEPLAERLLADPSLDPEHEAAAYLNPEAGFDDAKAVLDGARQILMERFAEDAGLLAELRAYLAEHGMLVSTVIDGKENEGAKFRDWFDFREALSRVPSHRALAMLRGRNEGVLRLALGLDSDPVDDTAALVPNPCEGRIAAHFGIRDEGRPGDHWLRDTVRWAWRVKLSLHLELELISTVRERAEQEAIRVFGDNLQDLLLAAPAGPRPTMGLDPGLRTGVKVAVVDATVKLLDTATIHPHEPRRDWKGALATLATLAARHGVELVAIGNGTASRETDRLVAELIGSQPQLGLTRVVVSEAGASVYSASELAAREFPELDVSLRGAVSIARRLQDPLAELVKIDPKSIGVGQYQHDLSQPALARRLDAVVEDCVNAVGVDVNTASPALLARVAGLNASLAANIVAHRDDHGPFRRRRALRDVPRLGERTFEQAAGFLRIMDGDDPLDASAVHPESYPVVERILSALGRSARELIGDSRALAALDPARFTDERFGLPTVRDILAELDKPGRDPRPEFRAARFRDGIEKISDLATGMQLEGVVTNVTNFGAFVDVGVHQDGLVHISAMSERFVRDPRELVKAGDIVRVKVIEVDTARKRIALTMRLKDATPDPTKGAAAPQATKARPKPPRREAARAAASGVMADALARALKR